MSRFQIILLRVELYVMLKVMYPNCEIYTVYRRAFVCLLLAPSKRLHIFYAHTNDILFRFKTSICLRTKRLERIVLKVKNFLLLIFFKQIFFIFQVRIKRRITKLESRLGADQEETD